MKGAVPSNQSGEPFSHVPRRICLAGVHRETSESFSKRKESVVPITPLSYLFEEDKETRKGKRRRKVASISRFLDETCSQRHRITESRITYFFTSPRQSGDSLQKSTPSAQILRDGSTNESSTRDTT